MFSQWRQRTSPAAHGFLVFIQQRQTRRKEPRHDPPPDLLARLAGIDSCRAQRRPLAQQVVAFADRLTRMATVRPGLRGVRNLLLSTLSRIPFVRRQLAWRLSGLIYR